MDSTLWNYFVTGVFQPKYGIECLPVLQLRPRERRWTARNSIFFWFHGKAIEKAQNLHFCNIFFTSKYILPFLWYFRSYLQKNSFFGEGKTELWWFQSLLDEIAAFWQKYACYLSDSVFNTYFASIWEFLISKFSEKHCLPTGRFIF